MIIFTFTTRKDYSKGGFFKTRKHHTDPIRSTAQKEAPKVSNVDNVLLQRANIKFPLIKICGIIYATALWASSLNTLTTDSNANQLGISSPARSICLNLVPDRFLIVSPFSLAYSAVTYSSSCV